MKVLTPLTGSAGLDVSSANVDSINLGSSGSENSDASVDNLTVWANAEFNNNVTLGSSGADTVFVKAPFYGSSSLIIGSINASASTDIALKVGTKVADGTVDLNTKLLSIRTGLSGTETEKAFVRKDGGGYFGGVYIGPYVYNNIPAGGFIYDSANANVGYGNAGSGVLFGVNLGSGLSFTPSVLIGGLAYVNGGSIYGGSAPVSPGTGTPNYLRLISGKGASASDQVIVIASTVTASAAKLLSLKTGIDTAQEKERLYINMSGAVASTSGTLVLRGDIASASSDIAVKVGTTVADSVVDLNTKLFSVRTELTGTEKEYFYVSKNFVSASQYVGDGSLLTGITASAMQDLRKLLYYINNGPAETYSQAYLEITPSGSLFPTSSIWYTDSTKTAKIYEEYYERYSGSATLIKPNPIQYKLYQADGVNVLITATDTITYAGPTILSISRSIT